ncbi:MAG: hypothetical protein EBY45_02385, partial [Gammaproteobacteria bacterium]|nr:hypothetical protein [Gammaproteobacteria bacterium]
MIRPRLHTFVLIILAVAGCATPSQQANTVGDTSDPVQIKTPKTQIDRPETPIPDESLLPLLEAEFALRTRNFDRGMVLLADQAVVLSDPALARRALRLAEFLNDPERATAMAMRLAELDSDDGAAAAAASGWLSR